MGTIKSSREIDRIFGESKRAAHPLVIALVSKTPEGRGPQGRVAFIAGKRMGGAVLRNRCKRVMRAAVRRIEGPWAGFDVLLVARAQTATAPAAELDVALLSVVRRAGVPG
jgi:ribonuclease P protein component